MSSLPTTLSAEAKAPGPGFGPVAARNVFVALWTVLVGFQGLYLCHLSDNLGYLSDPHAEADTMRAAEAYLADGLSAHQGLARILYGRRFPHDGTVKDHVDASFKSCASYSNPHHRGSP
jgi:hypothetical protein